LFTGDTFGLAYTELRTRGAPLLAATTTPVAFDPDAWFDSLDRMMALGPSACCLTHFGRIDQPQQYVESLRHSIRAHADIALQEEQRESEGRAARLHDAVERLLVDTACAHSGLPADRVREIYAADIELNAQGLNVWLVRRAKRRG
jgi:glyoxylase-like metal-dependent hydrolase (beta-lactamase superfamily II)